MGEPTPAELLRQARAYSVGASVFADARAFNCLLTYIEQRHADASGPARTPGEPASTLQRYASAPRDIPDYTREPKCKVCGCLSWSLAHSLGQSPSAHAFVPPDDAPPTVTQHDWVSTQEEPLLWFDSQEEFDHAAVERVAELQAATTDAGRARLRELQRAIDERTTAALKQQGITLAGTLEALDLDALQRLCDAATPGPWVYSELLASIGGRDGALVCAMTTSQLDEAGDEQNPQAAADGEFLEAARDALPRLIAKVRELQAAELSALCALAKANDRAHLAECRLQDVEVEQFVAKHGTAGEDADA